jgi:S-adenosylmethionine hydrolase
MSARPLVLLTDYGATDFYAGVTRAVLCAASPASRVIDLQHGLPAHDIAAASFVLARSLRYLPADVVIVVVVDPGVGTARRGLIVTLDARVMVGPDNGFASDALALHGAGGSPPEFLAIDESAAGNVTGVKAEGTTFHGRDIFAPVAAAIARGVDPRRMGDPVHGITMLHDVPGVSIDGACVRSTARYVDHFGNVLSDIPLAVIRRVFGDEAGVRVVVAGRDLGALRRTYADGAPGEPMALINGWGLVEAAVNGARAIDHLGNGAPRSIRFEVRGR